MLQDEAAEALQAKTALSIGALIARDILQPASLADGTEGVTRSSVEAELTWRRQAGFWRRLRRRLGGILHWASF